MYPREQGSKILQIFSRLEGYVEETPFIICTSTPTEYTRDLAVRHHFMEIPLGSSHHNYVHRIIHLNLGGARLPVVISSH
jgi:hypothetical protein